MKIDILAIVAHPDDAELGCSGTLLKHKQLGYSIGIVDLTAGELGSRGTAVTREQEAAKSSEILGLSARENLNIGDGTFENNAATRIKIIQQIRRFKPEIIITNAIRDRHPDHGRAAKLVADACFYSGLIKIETTQQNQRQDPWRPKQLWHMIQDYHIEPDIVIDITEHWEAKLSSIEAFSTQFSKETANSSGPQTPISTANFWHSLEARARTLARPIGADFAEGFTKSRYIGISDLFDLS